LGILGVLGVFQVFLRYSGILQNDSILQAWQSLDEHTFTQIEHCLIDERHFSDVIDVMARKSTNIDSDHMLVVIKMRARNTKPQKLTRFAVERLKDRDVASYYNELEPKLQGVQAQPQSLDAKCKKLKETILRATTRGAKKKQTTN
jgi:hypothetical protein